MSPASVIFAPFRLISLLKKNSSIMGRGDKKTKRGKISNGSYGKSRPAREIVRKTAAKTTEKKAGE
jgi:30S ribosomal protein S31